MTEQVAVDLSRTLTAFLRHHGILGEGDHVSYVQQIDGGWSRNTYLAEADIRGASEKLIVRAESGGGLTGAGLAWEYDVYKDLHGQVTVPKVLAIEPDPANDFGGPYFVMEHVEGSAPNLWKSDVHAPLQSDWETKRGIARDFTRNLASIHLIGETRAPIALERLSYEDLVTKWETEYHAARLAHDPIVEEALVWLRECPPSPGRTGVVHGDYRLGNLLVDEGGISAVLDWELAHVGDVNYDLGYVSLDYIAGRHLTPKTHLLAGVAEHEWFFREYERLTGDKVDLNAIRTWSVLSLVALIVMAMTGFQAFEQGKTQDVRRIWSRWALPGLRRELTERAGW